MAYKTQISKINSKIKSILSDLVTQIKVQLLKDKMWCKTAKIPALQKLTHVLLWDRVGLDICKRNDPFISVGTKITLSNLLWMHTLSMFTLPTKISSRWYNHTHQPWRGKYFGIKCTSLLFSREVLLEQYVWLHRRISFEGLCTIPNPW